MDTAQATKVSRPDSSRDGTRRQRVRCPGRHACAAWISWTVIEEYSDVFEGEMNRIESDRLYAFVSGFSSLCYLLVRSS